MSGGRDAAGGVCGLWTRSTDCASLKHRWISAKWFRRVHAVSRGTVMTRPRRPPLTRRVLAPGLRAHRPKMGARNRPANNRRPAIATGATVVHAPRFSPRTYVHAPCGRPSRARFARAPAKWGPEIGLPIIAGPHLRRGPLWSTPSDSAPAPACTHPVVGLPIWATQPSRVPSLSRRGCN